MINYVIFSQEWQMRINKYPVTCLPRVQVIYNSLNVPTDLVSEVIKSLYGTIHFFLSSRYREDGWMEKFLFIWFTLNSYFNCPDNFFVTYLWIGFWYDRIKKNILFFNGLINIF